MADINIFTSETDPEALTRCTVTSGAASVSKTCRNSKVLSCLSDLATSLGPLASTADVTPSTLLKSESEAEK
jgi:hypothetical protein